MARDLRVKRGLHSLIKREEHKAARLDVQALQGLQIAGVSPLPLKIGAGQVGQGRATRAVAVHEDAGRLVDAKQDVVQVDDVLLGEALGHAGLGCHAQMRAG